MSYEKYPLKIHYHVCMNIFFIIQYTYIMTAQQKTKKYGVPFDYCNFGKHKPNWKYKYTQIVRMTMI